MMTDAHACCVQFWGFVDDLELHLRPTSDDGSARCVIAVRSASRVGTSDFGVNRKRVEALRSLLAAAGVVEAGRTESGDAGETDDITTRLV